MCDRKSPVKPGNVVLSDQVTDVQREEPGECSTADGKSLVSRT